MRATDENRLPSPPIRQHRPLARLTHDRLGEQLTPVISNTAAKPRVRDIALDIATACRVAATAPAAVHLALAAEEPTELRTAAALLVAELGSEGEKRQLVSLTNSPLSDDPADQLKGAALLACWSLLTPEELFAALTPMRRSNFAGTYALLLTRLEKELPEVAIVAGSDWLARADRSGAYFDGVARRIVELALSVTDEQINPTVIANLGAFVRRRSRAPHERVRRIILLDWTLRNGPADGNARPPYDCSPRYARRDRREPDRSTIIFAAE